MLCPLPWPWEVLSSPSHPLPPQNSAAVLGLPATYKCRPTARGLLPPAVPPAPLHTQRPSRAHGSALFPALPVRAPVCLGAWDKMAPRMTYRRRLSYHTKSNAVKIVKTPGEAEEGAAGRAADGRSGPCSRTQHAASSGAAQRRAELWQAVAQPPQAAICTHTASPSSPDRGGPRSLWPWPAQAASLCTSTRRRRRGTPSAAPLACGSTG